MGTKLSHHRTPKPGVIITITPRKDLNPPPPPPTSSSPMLSSCSPSILAVDDTTDRKSSSRASSVLSDRFPSARCISRTSDTSAGSFSTWKDKRRVSFDLLAEMAVVMPNSEEPLKSVLVEVGEKVWEEEALDMGDICDGSSTTSGSDIENGSKAAMKRQTSVQKYGESVDEACCREGICFSDFFSAT